MNTTLGAHVSAYVRYCQGRRGNKPSTAKQLSYTLHDFARMWGNRPVDQLGPGVLDDYLRRIQRHPPSTQRVYMGKVVRFLRWLHHTRVIRRDITFDVPVIKQPRNIPVTFNPEEVAAVLEYAPDARARLIVWLTVGLGLRCVEVSRLGWTDYDERHRVIVVRGKNDRVDQLPVPDEVAAAIAAYDHPRPGPMIRSVTQPWRGLDAGTISKYVARWCYLAGVKHAPYDRRGAHCFRRTAITDVIDLTDNPEIGQEMARHGSIDTTMKFYKAKLRMERLRVAMAGRDYAGVPSASEQSSQRAA